MQLNVWCTIGFVELNREKLASLRLLLQLLFKVITPRRKFLQVSLGPLQRQTQFCLQLMAILNLTTSIHQSVQQPLNWSLQSCCQVYKYIIHQNATSQKFFIPQIITTITANTTILLKINHNSAIFLTCQLSHVSTSRNEKLSEGKSQGFYNLSTTNTALNSKDVAVNTDTTTLILSQPVTANVILLSVACVCSLVTLWNKELSYC